MEVEWAHVFLRVRGRTITLLQWSWLDDVRLKGCDFGGQEGFVREHRASFACESTLGILLEGSDSQGHSHLQYLIIVSLLKVQLSIAEL